jgi:hypothetical protein
MPALYVPLCNTGLLIVTLPLAAAGMQKISQHSWELTWPSWTEVAAAPGARAEGGELMGGLMAMTEV